MKFADFEISGKNFEVQVIVKYFMSENHVSPRWRFTAPEEIENESI